MIVTETTRRNEALNTEPTRSKRIHSAVSTRILQVLAVGCHRQIRLNRALFDGPIRCIPNATFTVILKRGGTLVTVKSVVKQMDDFAEQFDLDHNIVCRVAHSPGLAKIGLQSCVFILSRSPCWA